MMSETLTMLPISFWVVLALLATGCAKAALAIRSGLGLPMLAVYGTTAAWYVLDPFYNGYERYTQTFAPEILESSWWEVVLFLAVFMALAPVTHRIINKGYLSNEGLVYRLLTDRNSLPDFQNHLNMLARACALMWLALTLFAAIRLGQDFLYYLFPLFPYKADPFGRGRIGTGFDSLLSLGSYFHLFVSSSFGVVAALATKPSVRRMALLGCALTWPYYVFDRTRNTMLISMVPGVAAWIFLRLKGSWLKKMALCGVFLFLINTWFGFVIANRSSMSISQALQERGLDLGTSVARHHEGLNMYEELCWINALMANGLYAPNRGERYLAELVNPIPRALWPEKPMIGIDYAVARGQTFGTGDAGVGASISTGMIGQGVVNFGSLGGPSAAALLMSCWVVVLARSDLKAKELILYCLGLVMTFNLGRDITLITLYTYVFGALLFSVLNRKRKVGDQIPRYIVQSTTWHDSSS